MKKIRLLSFIFFASAMILLFYYMSRSNYLLFHSLAELFSIIIAGGIFLIVWNTRKISESAPLFLLGIAYFFISILDLLHTLGYKGMKIFTDYDFYANQLWVAARFMEAVSLFIVGLFSNRKKIPFVSVFYIYLAFTTLAVVSIFFIKVFPVCFIADQGQTLFKIAAEYVIIVILATGIYFLHQKKKSFSPVIYKLLFWSMVITIASEFSFTLYTDNYGILNFVGHIFKIISFFLIYKAIIETNLKHPYDMIFKKLKEKESFLEEANETKNKLFLILAHDLKAPFSNIYSLSEILIHDIQQKTLKENEKDKYNKMIFDSAFRYSSLLENLLHWANTQLDQLECKNEKLDCYEPALEAFEYLEKSAEQKNIEIQILFPPKKFYADADRNMINAVLRNLVSNALKFTPRKGKIEILCGEEENYLIITVKDNGLGMSESMVKKLFEKNSFNSTYGTEQEKGTGVGLVICKEFVNKNGGELRVESQLGKGSIFSFSLLKSENSASMS
ncbi:MAG TPA: hypothetical protein DHW82_10480 [Spirochaetia bacterium]|nr:MAG: hypothetical protein A2Y41_00220 [Spirochaetes bacterium GWB1_36_13]HCL57418.1 hypothetical protein [Spirochaetia bacterium]